MPRSSLENIERYKRHILLDQIGEDGQKKLLQSSVLVVGLGGLGCPVVQYLAASGVGRLGLCDFDNIEESNLQRQVLYSTKDIGRRKTEVAKEKLVVFDPEIEIEIYENGLEQSTAQSIASSYDLIIDCTDNFETRYLLNDVSKALKIPMVYGALHKFEGQVSVFNFKDSPCYQCIFPEDKNKDFIPNCEEAGVLGILPGIIGLFEAMEAIKIILDGKLGESLAGYLLIYDALNQNTRRIKLKKNSDCRFCTTNTLEQAQNSPKAKPVSAKKVNTITATQLKEMVASGDSFLLIDVRSQEEHLVERIPGSINFSLPTFYNLEEFLKENPGLLNPEAKTILYCQSGARSKQAMFKLMEHGFSEVYNLIGGFSAWKLASD